MEETIKSINEYQQLLRTVFDAYLEQLNTGGLEPSEGFLSYDFEEEIDARQWSYPLDIANEMVKDELRELTNDLNQWQDSLLRWHAWNKIIQPYNTDEVKAWELRSEFLEPLVFYCLFQPASSRDRFTFVVTNAMHQVRLMVEDGYPDHLEGEPKTLDKKKELRYPNRRLKEKRLSKLISIWPERDKFMASLRAINDKEYEKETTSDYRNRHSHIIGPRLGIGHVRTVVRSVREHTTFTKQPDGTCVETPTGKMVQVYGAGGGTPPLDLEKAYAANLDQYRRARKCYASYRKLLTAGMEAMPLAK
jgi:hypothetical protein